jgi:hypothetical protein
VGEGGSAAAVAGWLPPCPSSKNGGRGRQAGRASLPHKLHHLEPFISRKVQVSFKKCSKKRKNERKPEGPTRAPPPPS